MAQLPLIRTADDLPVLMPKWKSQLDPLLAKNPAPPVISLSCGTFTTTNTLFTDVPNLTITITTNGGPILLLTQADGQTNPAVTTCSMSSSSGNAFIRILRGADVIANYALDIIAGSSTPCNIVTLDPVAAGTYTYRVQANAVTGTTRVEFARLIAREL